MEFKKCERCGCFFASEDAVCVNCLSKDKLEMSKLKDYFNKENYSNSISAISIDTGITVRNLNRYLAGDEFNNKLKNTLQF